MLDRLNLRKVDFSKIKLSAELNRKRESSSLGKLNAIWDITVLVTDVRL